MKKTTKKIAVSVAGVLAAGTIVIGSIAANIFFGNPISKHKAEKTAVAFIEENYPEHKFEVGDTTYGFKDAVYTTSVQLTDIKDASFTVVCNSKGEYKYDDYHWNALLRYQDAVEKELSPLLIEEFGEGAEPEISFLEFHELVESKAVKFEKDIVLDDIDYELDINIKIDSDEGNVYVLRKDTVTRIDKVVNSRFAVGKYNIDTAGDSEYIDHYIIVTADEARAMYE